MKTSTKLWIGIAVLAVLTPLGLYLPEKFNAGVAWGEWGSDEIRTVAGYVPAGLKKLSSLWNAALPDYSIKGWENKGPGHLSIAYILSALVGTALCVGAAFILGKFLVQKNNNGKKKDHQLH